MSRGIGAAAIALCLALTGCSGSGARADLAQSLEETQAAVRSVQTALQLLDGGSTTRAAAQVTAEDMADEIGSAQKRLVTTTTETDEERKLREQCQVVIAMALVAVQDAEDDLSTSSASAATRDRLQVADQSLTTATRSVGES